MFENLKEAWINEIYGKQRQHLIVSTRSQLSTVGLVLDLDSLPLEPYPFKELFNRWLILVNRDRLERGEKILVTHQLVLACPLWQIVKCPLKKLKLTPEKLFNKFTSSPKRINTHHRIGNINK